MCGIAGFLTGKHESSRRAEPRAAEVLAAHAQAMADAIAHRGPDDSGTWVDAEAGVALGHRRLSIIDLSAEGHQPMVSESGRFVLSYNGEIYDFPDLRAELEGAGCKFRGHSDTEVLLAAIEQWGVEQALSRVNGMFAFAVWDARERSLTLARDRLGKKPVYYGVCDELLLFGSELKALCAHPRAHFEVDRDALSLLVRYGYIAAPHSIYRGVRKLAAGTLVTLRPGEPLEAARPKVYWSACDVAEQGARNPFDGSDDEATDALDTLLRDAVGRRMISDVSLGALLSGGFDSTIVVAQMQAQSERPIQTFSIGFDEAEYNEAEHAKAVATHLGTDHTELYLTPQSALDLIPRLPKLYDEPFADPSQLPTFLVSQLARRDVTVVLTGDGGDELFAGYDRYFSTLRSWQRLAGQPATLRALKERGFAGLADLAWRAERGGWPGLEGLRARGAKFAKKSERTAARDAGELFARMSGYCRPEEGLVLGARQPALTLTDRSRWPDVPEPLQLMMFLDLTGYMCEDILVKVDRASMGVSLEVRNPLLDHRVVRFAWSLPLAMRVRDGERKWLLRQVLARYVPRSLTDRPKMGFGMPVGEWLSGPLRDWAEALLDERRLRDEGFLDPKAVRGIWEQHLSGWRSRHALLWNVLSFQAWLEARES